MTLGLQCSSDAVSKMAGNGLRLGQSEAGRQSAAGPRARLRPILLLLALVGWVAAATQTRGAEASLSEYQVKALFLVNFAKYVEWPATAFAGASAPIIVGVVGENNFGPHLEKAIDGKNVSGRAIQILSIDKDEDMARCHILFVSASEKRHLGEILNKVKALPVLTVGEAEPFLTQGGVINFTKKEGKVRLQIDLEAARKAKLQLSSKLLSVADSVTGK